MIAIWAIWVVSLISTMTSLATALLTGPGDFIAAFALGLAAFSFVTAGGILINRLPDNLIGWILALGGSCLAIENGATGLANLGLSLHPGSVPGAIWFAWLSEWVWAPAIGAVLILMLVYPTGQLLSARWRPVALMATAVIVLFSFAGAFGTWTAGSFPGQNPLQIGGGGTAGPMAVLNIVFGPLAFLVALLVVILTAASVVIRYRRAAGIERAQLKWFAGVAAISVPAFLVGSGLFGSTGVGGIVSTVATLVAFCGFALLPVAIGLAVLRYRLYEIDRLISRTISWAVITLTLGGTFVALILLVQALIAPYTGSNELAVVGSTLFVAALFQPLRRRVQRLVDHRFNRARYDAERTVAAFAARVRDEVDFEHLQAEILATVANAVEPSSVSLWLRE